MNQQEANKIAEVCKLIHDGCDLCINDMCARLNNAKLGFTFKIDDSVLGRFPLVVARPTTVDTEAAHRYFDAP